MSKPPLTAAALTSSALPMRIGVQEAVLLQAVGSLEDTGIRPFGKDDLTGIRLENFNQTVKHESFLQYDRASAPFFSLSKKPFGLSRQADFKIAKLLFVFLFCNFAAAAGY